MEAFMQTASEDERQKLKDELRRVTGIDNRKAAALREFDMAQKNQAWKVDVGWHCMLEQGT